MSMTPQQLKNSIFQLAIEGKCTNKLGSKNISINDKIYEIPENWNFKKMSDTSLSYANGNYAEKYPKGNELSYSGDVPFLRANNIRDGKIVTTDLKFISKMKHKELQRGHLKTNDIIVTIRGNIGACGMIPASLDNANLNAQLTIVRTNEENEFFPKYILYLFQSPIMTLQFKNFTTGTALKQLSEKNFHSCLLPVPPFAEQKRIVAKIEELLPYVDEYEKAWNKLEELNKRFPDDIKKSILQEAIQGKLVEQRPEEGTGEELYQKIQKEKQKLIKSGNLKKEKPLPEITDDEIPFDIPESWKWVRLGQIGTWGSGATPAKGNRDYYNGRIPWLLTGDLNDGIIRKMSGRITDKALSDTSVHMNPKGSVLMAMYGATIGKLGILGIAATTNQACCACDPFSGVDNKFLFYYLMARRKYYIDLGAGSGQPNISKAKIVISLFALPPLAEQKHIVAKIEELLPYINQLKEEK